MRQFAEEPVDDAQAPEDEGDGILELGVDPLRVVIEYDEV
jgi:hypothetical protein